MPTRSIGTNKDGKLVLMASGSIGTNKKLAYREIHGLYRPKGKRYTFLKTRTASRYVDYVGWVNHVWKIIDNQPAIVRRRNFGKPSKNDVNTFIDSNGKVRSDIGELKTKWAAEEYVAWLNNHIDMVGSADKDGYKLLIDKWKRTHTRTGLWLHYSTQDSSVLHHEEFK